MNSLLEKYKKEVVPLLQEKFQYNNIHAVPHLTKVVVNVGASKALKDPKYYEVIEGVLERITGQKPVKTLARKSISSFKIREGMVVGYKVTLHGKRMYDFVQKLVNVTLPRVRDFRGLSVKSFDGNGNYSLGFKEYIAFPEIRSDEIERLHGLEITIHTTATTDEQAKALLKALSFPLREEK